MQSVYVVPSRGGAEIIRQNSRFGHTILGIGDRYIED
jgi:hypothetical protein